MRLPLRESLVSQSCPPAKFRSAVLLVCAAVGSAAWAQPASGGAEPGLNLRSSGLLEEVISPAQRDAAPVFLQGDRLSGRTDLETVVEGDASLRKAGTVIKADRLEYDQPTDQARATGNVLINRGGSVYQGPLLELKVERFEGFFLQPRYQFLQNDAHGEADRVDFLDPSHAVIHNASYTTCKRLPGPSWMPATA